MTEIKLPSSIVSLNDLKDLIAEISSYLSWYSHQQIKAKIANKAPQEQFNLSPTAASLISDVAHNKQASSQDIEQLLAKLRLLAEKAIIVTITLAAIPSPGIKKTLTAWCRDNISDIALINFNFNREILGGMVIKTNNHIYDWSIRRQLIANKDKLTQALSHV